MSYVAGAAAGAAAAAAAIANAVKASGAIVRVEPEDFVKVISRADKPLIVHALGGILTKHHRYISGYQGLVFYAESREPLEFTRAVELVAAKKIWIPD
jgi:hypothetical protein